jgi:DsbC/DsbD-like thiol-disulfide interchange protein
MRNLNRASEPSHRILRLGVREGLRAMVLGGWIATAVAAPIPQPSDIFASAWSKGVKSAARLLVVGGGQEGQYRAGIEIHLEARTITYWRTPGDAGVPPVLSFAGSDNVADVRMLFPAPHTFDEAGAKAFGYDRHVIFPLRVTAKDPAKPVTLHLKLDYAACEKICIPAKAEAQLAFPQIREFGPYEDSISTFEAQVPIKLALGSATPLTITAVRDLDGDVKAGKAHFVVAGKAPTGASVNLFAEAPEGWFLQPAPIKLDADGTFATPVAILQSPKDGDVAKAQFTFTLVSGNRAIEVPARLDVKPAKP